VLEDGIQVPGDARSAASPGHGYAAYRHAYLSYEAYETEEEWKKRILALTNRTGTKFRALKVTPVEAIVKVEIL
jgi:hypothetical protein